MATTVKRKVVKARPAKPVAKKAPAKKSAGRSATKSTAAKSAATSSSKPRKAIKSVPAKKATKKTAGTNVERKLGVMNPHGFRDGSDQAIIVDALVTGGFDRGDVVAKAAAALPTLETRNGETKNVSSLVSALLRRLTADGYKVESSWRLVPPKRVQNKLDKQK